MINKLILAIVLSMVASASFAKEYHYQGNIKGMSCAFCVYNVRKQISKLPGVNAESVNVDLKTGALGLSGSAPVDVKKITSFVTKAGFKLINFKQATVFKLAKYKKDALVSLKLNVINIKDYKSLLEKVSDLAAQNLAKLVVRAPKSMETSILKSMIAGRQKVARVEFVESEKKAIEISVHQKLK